MRLTKLAAAVAATCVAAAGLAVAQPAQALAAAPDNPSDMVSRTHKPGELHVRERVPVDQKLPDGTPHPCAGRYLIYRDHVDPIYMTAQDGKPRMMVVAGSAVVPAEDVCLRLGPDSAGGRETSRIVVPNNPDYSFLGKPGRILWYAPLTRPDNSSPLWAGVGAYDPEHEVSQPQVKDNLVTLMLADFAGPGRMNVFIDAAGRKPQQVFNSADPDRRSYQLGSGGHAHMSFAFTKPGIYHTTWQGSYLRPDSTPVTAPATDVVWLVGTNRDAGLPDSFPRTHDNPQVTAEMMRDQAGLADPHDTDDGLQGGNAEVVAAPPPSLSADAKAGIDENFADDGQWGENSVLADGSVRLVQADAAGADDEYSPNPVVPAGHPDATQTYVQVSDTKDGLACLADLPKNATLRRAGVGGWLWATGRGGTPGVSIDLSTLEAIDRTKPVTYVLSLDARGGNGIVAVGHWTKEGVFDTVDRSDDNVGADIEVPSGQPFSFDTAFTKPGLYAVTLTINYTRTDGNEEKSYATTTLYFIVGNDAINEFRTQANVDGRLPAGSRAGETCVAPTPPSGGDTGVTPQPGPAPAQPSDCLLRAAWANKPPSALITAGHMDIGPNAEGVAQVHDTADPAHPKDHGSGDFVFVLPGKAEKLSVGATGDLADMLAAGVYSIPMTQQGDRPWVGFSTQHYPSAQVTGGIDLTMTPRVLPQGGRIVLGQGGGLTPWQTLLDSRDGTLRRHYAEAVHEHPATLFSAPGVYVVDYTFAWKGTDGRAHATTLRATYAVGDQAKAQVEGIKTHPAAPAECAGVDVPAPAGPPAAHIRPQPGPGKAGQPGTPKAAAPGGKSRSAASTGAAGLARGGAPAAPLPLILTPRTLPAAQASAAAPSASVSGADAEQASPAKSSRVKDDLPAAAAPARESGWAANGLLTGILVGVGATLGVVGLGALVAALVISRRRRVPTP